MPIELAKTNMYVVDGPPAGNILLAKTNMYVVDGPPPGSILLGKANLYVVDNGLPEQPSEEYQVFQAGLSAGLTGETAGVRVSKASAQGITINDALSIEASQANLTLPVVTDLTMQATKANCQVVCLGKKELPHILAWTATLDGHDYYFLQLSDLTLVYDFHSEQWYNWGSAARELWRAQIGIDWNANLGHITGQGGELGASSILVGDYISGALYFLDPNLNEDEDYAHPGKTLGFQRLTYGQLTLRGIDYIPCNGVQISGSIGENVNASDMDVTLSYSDDQGHTFVNAGSITFENGNYEQNFHWRSLGSFRGPGRIFKIEDWGAFVRIDGLDMDDGNGE